MNTIMDYLDWRGDFCFDYSKFNEVDALIFSLYNYVDINIKEKTRITTVAKDIFVNLKTKNKEESRQISKFEKKMLKLFLKSSITKRFRGTFLLDIVEKIDEESELQFQAMTFMLSTGELIVTYKGTDDSLFGFKEDFNMSFNKPVIGQVEAARYLKRILKEYDNERVYVAGHSKGGNFAVFAVSSLSDVSRDRIETVYNFDGPGFTESVLNSRGYKKTLPKVKKFIPKDSMVGILMDNKEDTKVVEAFGHSGFDQHDGFSWGVNVDSFVGRESSSKKSMFVDKTMKLWIQDIKYEDRKIFVDSVYKILREKMDISKVEQLDMNKIKLFIQFMANLRKLDEKERSIVQWILIKLIKSSAIAGKEL